MLEEVGDGIWGNCNFSIFRCSTLSAIFTMRELTPHKGTGSIRVEEKG